MSVIETSSPQIVFPVKTTGNALAIPETPPAPITDGLAQFANNPAAAETELVCNKLLVGSTAEKAHSDASKLLDQMLTNTAVFSSYGTDALADVNALVDRLLHEVGPVNIPELKALMDHLNEQMRGIKRKYDVSDPKVRERYDGAKHHILDLFHHARSMLDMLMQDVTSIEHQMDNVSKELNGRRTDLVRNITMYDVLYSQNEAEIGKLIYVIGVMELIRDLAKDRAAAVKVGNVSLGDRGGEQQATLAEFASNMDIKIAEYKGRLMVAWSTSPQVRMMRTLNVGLAEKINELLNVTIPTMKETILQWRLLMQSQDAAQLSQAVADSANEWIQAYEHAGAVVVPLIAQAVQTPSLSPETIAAIADSIAQQATGIVQAMQDGAKRRQEMDHAMLAAQQVLAHANAQISAAELNQLVGSAIKGPLEIASHVPASA